MQQTLDQASELEGLDVDLVQNLISSTGNVEEFNAAIEELKRSTEQAKGIKTFSKDITELSKRVLELISFQFYCLKKHQQNLHVVVKCYIP